LRGGGGSAPAGEAGRGGGGGGGGGGASGTGSCAEGRGAPSGGRAAGGTAIWAETGRERGPDCAAIDAEIGGGVEIGAERGPGCAAIGVEIGGGDERGGATDGIGREIGGFGGGSWVYGCTEACVLKSSSNAVGGRTSVLRAPPSRISGGGASRRCAAGAGMERSGTGDSAFASSVGGGGRAGALSRTDSARGRGAGGGVGGGIVAGLRTGGGGIVVGARGGSCTPVGGALRARRGGSGGSRRPHALHTASSSAFSALQNGQNLTAGRA
jgi:hypothetical protein